MMGLVFVAATRTACTLCPRVLGRYMATSATTGNRKNVDSRFGNAPGRAQDVARVLVVVSRPFGGSNVYGQGYWLDVDGGAVRSKCQGARRNVGKTP